jgi:hypothetical protein
MEACTTRMTSAGWATNADGPRVTFAPGRGSADEGVEMRR